MLIFPKFSIITITRNNRVGLANTLESIRGQSFKDFEVIVIDGNSTDGSEQIVSKFGDIIQIFENDDGRGIYPAMNQGIARARGEWVIFMNSGDIFSHEKALELFNAPNDSDIAFGRARKPDGSPHLEFRGWEEVWKHMPFCHQSVFTKRKLLLERPFDERYQIVADYEFLLWAYSNDCRFYPMDYEVSQIEEGGISESALVKRVWETYLAARSYFPQLQVHRYYYGKMKWALKEQFVVRRLKKR